MQRATTVFLAVGLLAAPAMADDVVRQLRQQLEQMQRQLRQMQEQIDKQQTVIDRLGGAPPPATAAAAAPPPPQPAWSPAQPLPILRGSRGYLNLSLDVLTDAGWSTQPDVPGLQLGDHDPIQRGFTLANAELAFDGAVDPYFKGFANVILKLDEHNETEVELEEAYGLTTALPWNLQAKVGQFLTEFGRINPQHPHAWDFVDAPLVTARILGPEGLRNPGARVSWLLPAPFYAEILGTVQNSQGGTAWSFRNGEEEPLFGRPHRDRGTGSPADLLYTPRAVAAFDLTAAQTLVAGLSAAFGPNDSGRQTHTQLFGGDVYWKWKPAAQAGGFPFVALQAEGLGRRYEAGGVTDEAGRRLLPVETLADYGAYVQALWGFRPRWVAGLRFDWVGGQRGAFAPDEDRARRWRLSPNLTFHPTEFSRVRCQYNHDDGRLYRADDSVWVQLELVLGEHAAHRF